MKFAAAALVATVSANTHDFMGEDDLLGLISASFPRHTGDCSCQRPLRCSRAARVAFRACNRACNLANLTRRECVFSSWLTLYIPTSAEAPGHSLPEHDPSSVTPL